MLTDTDRTVAAAAARQLGLFTRTQAYEAGASPTVVLTRSRSGDWIPLSRQVFRLPGAPVTWRQSLLAAVLNHPVAVVAGRAAVALHGLDGATEGRAEIVVPFEANCRSRLAVVHRSQYYETMATTVVDGIPVQSTAEAVAVAARGMLERDLARVLDTALRRRQVAHGDLVAVVERHADDRLKHIGVLAALLDERDPLAPAVQGTVLEQKLDELLRHRAIPPAQAQVPLGLLETGRSVVDRFIPDWRLIVEADGRTWHTRGEDFERDRHRDNGAARIGLSVLRFTWPMLTRDFNGCRATLIGTGVVRANLRS